MLRLLIILAALLMPLRAEAEDSEGRRSVAALDRPYSFPTFPFGSDDPALPPAAAGLRWGEDAAPWLPRLLKVLKANRPNYLELMRTGLIDGAGGRKYLVTEWGRVRGYTDFHLLRWTTDGRPYLKFLRRVPEDGGFGEIVWPTGMAVFAGETPVVAVYEGSGGAWIVPYRIRLFALRRNTVDITPYWAGKIVDVIDLDGDGQVELATRIDAWQGYFTTPSVSGPFMFAVLAWRDGTFVPACRAHPMAFLTGIAHRRAWIRHGASAYGYQMEGWAGILFDFLQIGDFSRADAVVRLMMAETIYTLGFDLDELTHIARNFGDLVLVARRYADTQCPGMAALADGGFGGHHGAVARIEHFRFDDHE